LPVPGAPQKKAALEPSAAFSFSISRNRERDDGCCWPLPTTATAMMAIHVVPIREAVVV